MHHIENMPLVLTSIPVAGQRRRGYVAVCGHCGVSHSEAVNTFAGPPDKVRELQVVRRKFEAIGWQIGKTSVSNRCPGCHFAAITAARNKKRRLQEREQQREQERQVIAQANGAQHPQQEQQPQTQQAQQPVVEQPVELVVDSAVAPPTMSREHKRLIFGKLDEVYDEAYDRGWSDARIAKDLDVPRAWVADVRKEFFGDDGGNEEVRQLVEEARMLLVKMDQVLDPMRTTLRDMNDRWCRLSKQLSDVEKLLK